jgi:riboflavin kinase/FMN adenylyltransferase
MQIVHGLGTRITEQPTALTIGVFDGVHRGHQHLISHAIRRGQALGGQSAVLSFDPHPDLVIHPERRRLYLTSLDERAALLDKLGVDLLVIEAFDRALMALSAQAFMQRICGSLPLRELYVGSNFALGKGREGNIERLNEIGRELGYQVFEVEPLLLHGAIVSSTRIREHLRAGELEAVQPLLGRPYSLRGPIVEGDKRGRTIGFPTANIAVDELHLLPADGVYVCAVTVEAQGDAQAARYFGVANIGVRPTFAGMQRRVEVYLLDFSGDLYGRTLQIDLLQRLRPEQRFGGVDELVAQIQRDVADARAFLAS